jgi:hypothetical protein
MLSPGSAAILSEDVVVQVSASDNIGVASLTLSLDGTVQNTFSEGPYNWGWDTTTVSYGVHTLSATALDYQGNAATVSISVTVDNRPGLAPPQITILSPRQNVRVAGTVSVVVNATDDLAVRKVELYADGVLQTHSQVAPFTTKWDLKKVTAGSHTIQCKAYDGNGNATMSAPVTVTR